MPKFLDDIIASGGSKVGIGTTTPIAAFQVGSITTTAMNQVIGKARIVGTDYAPSSTQMGTLDIASTTRSSSSPFNVNKGPSLSFSQNISGYVDGYEVVLGAIKTISRQTGNTGQEAAMTFLINGGTSTGVVERMRIEENGSVGIGTASPSNKLHVDLGSSSDRFLLTLSGSNKAIINGSGNGIFYGSLTSYGNSLGGGGGTFNYRGGMNTSTIGHRFMHVNGTNFLGSSGTQTMLSVEPLINQSSSAGYTGIKLNVTETATGSGTKNLLDLQVGGTSKTTISSTGSATFAGSVTATGLDINGNADISGTLNIHDEILTTANGSLLEMYQSSWSTASNHDILYQSWNANTDDFIYLKSPGNSTNDHGIAFIGDQVIAFGRTQVEQGNPELTSAAAPLNDNWLVLNNTGATFAGNLSAKTTTIQTPSAVALANQPSLPLNVSNGGQSVDGRVFINVKHDKINTASAIGAGLQMQAGAVTTGTASYFSSQIFLQSAGVGNHTIHSAPKGFKFYVDNHDTAAGSGTSYGAYGDLALSINEDRSIDVATNLNVDGILEGDQLDINGVADISGILTTHSTVNIGAAQKLYLDGGSNTYIHEASSDTVSIVRGGTTSLTVSSAGISSANNVYSGTSSSFRNYSGTWQASTGLTGNGFTFVNSVDGTALTLSSTGNATFAGQVEATSLDINGSADISGVLSGGRVFAKGVYCAGSNTSNGFLIETDISTSDYAMIHGTIKLEQFNFSTFQTIEFSATTHNNGTVGSKAGKASTSVTIKLFNYNSKWYVWVPQPSSYTTAVVHIGLANAYQGQSESFNEVIAVTHAAVPSSGVSNSTDLICSDAVVSSSLDINGNADISGNITGVDNITASVHYVGNTSNYLDVATGLRLRSDSNGIRLMPNGTDAGYIKHTGISFVQPLTVTHADGLFVKNPTNGGVAQIKFSDAATGSYDQVGHIKYQHGNGASYGSGESFIIGGNQTSMTVLADGILMYKDGIYTKPASGTGAGTRKDLNWNTAYTHSQSAHAPSNAQANVAPTTAQVKTALNANLGTVTFGDSNDQINIEGNLTVTGITTMSGGTVVNTTTNTAIKDTTIALNTGIGGSTANVADIGLIFDRGSLGNAFMGWDESEDEFAFVKTSTEGADDVDSAAGGSAGIAIANDEAYLKVKVGSLESVGTITSNGTTLTGTQTSVSGNAGSVTNGVYTTGDQSIAGNKTFTNDVYVHHDDGLQIGDTGNSSTARTTLTSFASGGNSRMKIKGGNFLHSVHFETSKNDFLYSSLSSSYNGSDSSFNLYKSNSDTTGTAATTTISTGTSTFAGAVTVGGHIMPSSNGTYNLGSSSYRYQAGYFGGLSLSGALTTVNIQSQGAYKQLNKAQTAYLDTFVRDASGSEVVTNLSNIGSATFAGNVDVAKTLSLGSGSSRFIFHSGTSLVTGSGTSNATEIDWKDSTHYIPSLAYAFRVKLVVTGTGTDTGASYIVYYNNSTSAWVVRYINRAGTTSNHAQLTMVTDGNGTYMAAYHTHSGGYNIRYWVETFDSGDQDMDAHAFGSDFQWQRDNDNLTYLDGKVGIGIESPSGSLHLHRTGSGTDNTIITEDDARRIYIGRDSIKATDLSNNAAQLYIQQNDGHTTFGGNITVDGNADISGTLTLGGHLQEPILRTEVSVANSYVRIFTVTDASSQLATMTRLSGTSHGTGHVGNFTALIMTNHSGDVVVKSFSSFYTEVTIKVDTNTNADATISIKSDTSNAATYKLKIETLSPGATYALLPSSGINPAVSHEHSAGDGSNETGVGGTLTHDFGGEINAASLDISGNADIDGTLHADGLDVDGNADISGNITSAGWTGDVITSAYLDSDTMHLNVQQNITAHKEYQDSVQARFGTGADMKIQHTGTAGFITNATGDLNIRSDQTDGDIVFQGDNGAGGTHEYMRLDGTNERINILVKCKIDKRRFAQSTSTDGNHQGDVVYFGGATSMKVGRIYYYNSSGTWALADPNNASTSAGLLAVALGATSDTDGMLLRGMVTLDHDPGTVGDTLYLNEADVNFVGGGSGKGAAHSSIPAGSGDIVRIVGYCLHSSQGRMWFNPDNTFVEVA